MLAILALFATTAAQAQDAAPAAAGGISLADLKAMFDKQQAELEAQKKQIAAQQELLDKQSALITSLQEQQKKAGAADQQIVDQPPAVPTPVAQTAAAGEVPSGEDLVVADARETVEESVKSSENSSSTDYDIDSFPGSIPIPNTSAAIGIGGYVKMNVVESFDPIGSRDRFIVGSIPVPQDSSRASAVITVDQSRLNFDLRDQTSVGPLRAFIEGDFAGTGNTFRLRHAFGQYKQLLVGQTWSTFMDNEASPEELDFEGINGRINVRQPELRFFPDFAQDWNLLLAVENPDPEVTGGEGISQMPDVVISVRRTWFDIFHVKTALLLRNIEATWDDSPDPDNPVEASKTGWGLTASGRTAIPWWDERDNFLFQFNYGKGYGRYVNDLGTLCSADENQCFDAVFDPNGELRPFTVFAMYVAMQKWWKDNLRSNFNISFVDVSNFDFVIPGVYDQNAYAQTWRATGNVIWSPTARIDIGTELLWGRRENRDRQKASAMQLQISAKYRY